MGNSKHRKISPHCDKNRPTAEGEWMTRYRLMAGLRQSDLVPVLSAIGPGLENQGRPSELETGKRHMTPEIKSGLYTAFRQRLGDRCPPPP